MTRQRNIARKCLLALSAVMLTGIVSACAPDVGSPEWCQDMKEKPKGEWTANEAADFARHCVF